MPRTLLFGALIRSGSIPTTALSGGVISGSSASSPSQGTVRVTINGVNTDVDTGLQTGDSPSFAGLTVDTNTLFVDATNNRVGIVTTSPDYTLTVIGDAKISGSIGVNVNPNATDGRIDAGNDVVAYSSSDIRWKENITVIANALEKVNNIGGYEFDWKKLTDEEKKTQHSNEGHDIGVIAQEIQNIIPEVVKERDNGFLAVRYEKLIPLLIQAIKELNNKIEKLENKHIDS